ncbi:unnamed protein product [Caenorhabditis auriculariae]|uniref:Uncharacterized protein n=1 Tax=Caenorhabditis auriculariae TaxID=2777116 RepID=A0A8S1HW62_9PELO|nr:unnamed protein product [Caenorhabditis auriculariae]
MIIMQDGLVTVYDLDATLAILIYNPDSFGLIYNGLPQPILNQAVIAREGALLEILPRTIAAMLNEYQIMPAHNNEESIYRDMCIMKLQNIFFMIQNRQNLRSMGVEAIQQRLALN